MPEEDALIVRRLARAGAIMVGKTTTPEFAYNNFTESPLWGVTKNPWNTKRARSWTPPSTDATGRIPLHFSTLDLVVSHATDSVTQR